ncbi:hypothetical protein BTVI_98535 [Pitangus sulphuratus]|nr:hypothetical protein BTVI_98535 [Pitangus sulphuratus]
MVPPLPVVTDVEQLVITALGLQFGWGDSCDWDVALVALAVPGATAGLDAGPPETADVSISQFEKLLSRACLAHREPSPACAIPASGAGTA